MKTQQFQVQRTGEILEEAVQEDPANAPKESEL